MIQFLNAQNFATWLKWPLLQLYTQVLTAHFLVMGFCLYNSEVSVSTIAVIDVCFESFYTLFNMQRGQLDKSKTKLDFIAVLVPLYFMVEMINDSYLRLMREHIQEFLRFQELQRNYGIAKKGGIFPKLLWIEFNEKLLHHKAEEATHKKKSTEIKEFPEFKPTAFVSKSLESDCHELSINFVVPHASPEQLISYTKYQLSIKTGDYKYIEEIEYELGWSLFHGEFELPKFVARRDIVCDTIFVAQGDRKFDSISRSCEHEKYPKKKRMTRVLLFTSGYHFEPWVDEGGIEGTKVSIIVGTNPGGMVPPWYTNLTLLGQGKLKIKAFHDYFVRNIDPHDGSDNGGIWPDTFAKKLLAEKEAEDSGEQGPDFDMKAKMKQMKIHSEEEILKEEEKVLKLKKGANKIRHVLGLFCMGVGLWFGLMLNLSTHKAKSDCASSHYTKCVWEAFGKGSAHLYFEKGTLKFILRKTNSKQNSTIVIQINCDNYYKCTEIKLK